MFYKKQNISTHNVQNRKQNCVNSTWMSKVR